MELRIYVKSLYIDEYYALDVAKNTSFSLVNTNALFDFENLRYMRSTSLSVPRTARNEQVLSLAGNFHTTNSDYARKRISCRVWIDGVEKNGYMNITSVTNKEYNFTLLLGEYVSNDVLAKTTKEVLREEDYTGRVIYGRRSDVLAANSAAATEQFISPIAYYSGKDGQIDITKSRPSVHAKKLLDRCISNNLDDIKCRIVVKPVSESSVDGQFELQFDGSSGRVSFGGTDADKGSEYFERVYHGSKKYLTNVSVVDPKPETRKELHFFRAKQDVILKTGDSIDNPILVYTDEFYILSYATQVTGGIKHVTEATFAMPKFISTAKLKWNGSAGTLGGFEVTGDVTDTLIPAGTEFRCVRANDVYPLKSDVMPGGYIYQLSTIGGRSGNSNFHAYPDTDVIITREWDCIPDIKIADLLRSYAKMSGQLFYISGNTVDCFRGYTDDLHELSRVIEWTNLERRFSDFAQHTLVTYSDYKDNPTLIATYSVANLYLSESKEMSMLWGAGKQLASGDGRMYVTELGNGIWIGKVGLGASMMRTAPIANAAVTKLCTTSTLVKVKALMHFVIFENLPYYRHIRYDGAIWTWIECTWQDGVVDMTLQLDDIF